MKAADRLKRRVNLAELARAALAHHPDRYIAFQRFYIGPNNGFGTTQRVERLAEVHNLGYEWVQCSTEGAYPKTVLDAHSLYGEYFYFEPQGIPAPVIETLQGK